MDPLPRSTRRQRPHEAPSPHPRMAGQLRPSFQPHGRFPPHGSVSAKADGRWTGHGRRVGPSSSPARLPAARAAGRRKARGQRLSVRALCPITSFPRGEGPARRTTARAPATRPRHGHLGGLGQRPRHSGTSCHVAMRTPHAVPPPGGWDAGSEFASFQAGGGDGEQRRDGGQGHDGGPEVFGGGYTLDHGGDGPDEVAG